jgi:hypothetical protein
VENAFERSNGNLVIFLTVANESMGSALWQAIHIFSKTNKMVVK